MPTEREWKEAMRNVERGSSYAREAKRLGVSKAGLYKHHLSHLSRKVETEKKKLKRIRGKREGEEKKLGELKEKSNKWSMQKEQERKKCRKAESRLQDLTNLEDKAKKIKPKIEDFRNLDEALESQKLEFERAKKEVQELKETREELKSEAKSRNLELSEVLDYLRNCRNLEKRRKDLERKISGKRERSRKLNSRIGGLTKKKNKLQERVEFLKSMVRTTNQILRQRYQQIQDYNMQIYGLTQGIPSLQNEVKKLKGKRDEELGWLKVINEELELWRNTVDWIEKEKVQVERLKSKLPETAAEVFLGKYGQELKELREERDKVGQEIEKLNARREELRIQTMALGGKVEELRREAKLAEWDKGFFDIGKNPTSGSKSD